MAVIYEEGTLDPLLDIEFTALYAEFAEKGYQHVAAFSGYSDLNDLIDEFGDHCKADPVRASESFTRMFSVLSGLGDVLAQFESQDIIGGWALTRGLALKLKAMSAVVSITIHHGKQEDAEAILNEVSDSISSYRRAFGIRFEGLEQEYIEFVLGNCWTEIDPERAIGHFESSMRHGGAKARYIMSSKVNIANCYERLHRHGEAASMYASMESYYEYMGEYLQAAQVWIAECKARFSHDGDPSIYPQLVEAIRMYEDNIPSSADVHTLFTYKMRLDPAFQLLITLLSELEDIDDEEKDILLSTLWSLLSRDFKSSLDKEEEEDGWRQMIDGQKRPLARIRNLLQPLPGVGVVHTVLSTDRLDEPLERELPPNTNPFRLVWVVFGYDRDGVLRFETSVHRSDEVQAIYEFIEVMDDQLDADLLHDPLGLERTERRLKEISEGLVSSMPEAFRDALMAMDHLFYMPHPGNRLDEFPITGLRLNGEWLGVQRTITRVPTINSLLEILSPNRMKPKGGDGAHIAKGDPEHGGTGLHQLNEEVEKIRHMLSAIGFDPSASSDLDLNGVRSILHDGTGILHYVGHGHATTLEEGLPLTSEESITPRDIDALLRFNLPFAFICACEGGRIRYGPGGYQTGIASKIIERTGSSSLAFNMPVLEKRAYHLAHAFYRIASSKPFGPSVRELMSQQSGRIPSYCWLSLTAYGDPCVALYDVPTATDISMISDRARSWHSYLRTYSVLRTPGSLSEARGSTGEVPDQLRAVFDRVVNDFFGSPSAVTLSELDEMEDTLRSVQDPHCAGLLTLRSAITLERVHSIGMDEVPLRWPGSPDETRRCFNDLVEVMQIGNALFDIRLIGLAQAMFGRLVTWDNNSIEFSSKYLVEAFNNLRQSAKGSPYASRIWEETNRIYSQFSGRTLE